MEARAGGKVKMICTKQASNESCRETNERERERERPFEAAPIDDLDTMQSQAKKEI